MSSGGDKNTQQQISRELKRAILRANREQGEIMALNWRGPGRWSRTNYKAINNKILSIIQ